MRLRVLLFVILAFIPTLAEAAARTVTGTGTLECSSTSNAGAAGCVVAGGALIDGSGATVGALTDTYTVNGTITVTGTATSTTRKGIALTGAGGITVGAGGSLTASVPSTTQPLYIQVGTGGLASATGGTLALQGGWLPTYSSTQTSIQSTRPDKPMQVPQIVLFPSASVMRLVFPASANITAARPTMNRNQGQIGDSYLIQYLEAMQRYGDSDSAGTPRIDRDILFEVFDPRPDQFVSGSPYSRYRVLQVECAQNILAGCNNARASWVDSAGSAACNAGVAGDCDGDGVADLGFIDLSMRQFQGDYTGMDPSWQDAVSGTLNANVQPGQRCISLPAATFSVSSGLNARGAEQQYVGWWITLEKNSDIAPTRGNSYAIGKMLDNTSVLSDATNDFVCTADIGGAREQHLFGTAAENDFRIHRGIFPGDNWYAQIPVAVTRDSGATERTVSVSLLGTTNIDAGYFRAFKVVQFGTPSDSPDANVVATNMTFFDCEAAGGATNGGECVSASNVIAPINPTLEVDMRGFSGAGGGDCTDEAGTPCDTAPDGDVHFTQIVNFAKWDISYSSIRWARDDVYYKPAHSGAGVTAVVGGTWKAWYVEGSDQILGSFGTDTGNMFDGGISGTPTSGQYSDTVIDFKGAVCANCTTDDGAPMISVWNESGSPGTTGTRTSGSIAESGCLGCLGGGGFNDNYSPFAAKVTDFVSTMGMTARKSNAGLGGSLLIPYNSNGVFIGEIADLGVALSQNLYLWPRGQSQADIRRLYLRDIAMRGTTPLLGQLPNGGTVKDVVAVNLSMTRLMATDLPGTNVNPLTLSDITIAETNDWTAALAATRWGTGPNGLFLGTPATRSNALLFAAFTGPPSDAQRAALLTVDGLLVTNFHNATTAIERQGSADVTSVDYTGNLCAFDNGSRDIATTVLAAAVTTQGQSFIADRMPDVIDPIRGYYATPQYSAQYGCGASVATGVCRPTYFTRRYNLDPLQYCSAGWAGATSGTAPDGGDRACAGAGCNANIGGN